MTTLPSSKGRGLATEAILLAVEVVDLVRQLHLVGQNESSPKDPYVPIMKKGTTGSANILLEHV